MAEKCGDLLVPAPGVTIAGARDGVDKDQARTDLPKNERTSMHEAQSCGDIGYDVAECNGARRFPSSEAVDPVQGLRRLESGVHEIQNIVTILIGYEDIHELHEVGRRLV